MNEMLVRALLLSAILGPAAGSAQDYPGKLVTIVVPFSAGGSNDVIARYLAEHLGKLWKQNVVVENRPGAGSSIGAANVAKSPADGYRMLFVSSSYTTNAATRSDHGFDPLKDLKASNMVGRGHNAVVTGPRVPIATLADLSRESKAKAIFYATSGVGSSQHFNAELLSDAMGIKMTAVPYRGGNEGLIDLVAGRIDVVVGVLAGQLPHIKSGKAKPIAVLSKTRSPVLPEVPTAPEQGYPNAVTENYWAIFVPTATPDAIVARINQAVKTVTNSPEGRQFLAKLDGEPTEMEPAEITAHVRREIEYWTRLARQLNLVEK
jgi:tripartite-type tricarboxylate transporter receptor subunit TctC